MFKPTKKKPSKAKEKVDFKLEFHATRVPQRGWDRLMVSLISLETNKVTAKTGKVHVKNGACLWSDPVYDSPLISQDAVGKDNSRAPHKLLVSMGLSRFGILGEATIDFADYMQAAAPVSLPLQLQNCSSGTILYVKIQRIGLDTPCRELEGQQDTQRDCKPAVFDVNLPSLDETSGSISTADKDDCASTCLSLDSLEAPRTPEVSECRPYNRDSRGREELASPCSSIGSCSGRQDLGNAIQEYVRFSEVDASNQPCIGNFASPAEKASVCFSPSHSIVSSGDKDGGNGRFEPPEMLAWSNSKGMELEATESTIKELRLQCTLWEQRSKQTEVQMELLQKQHLDERTRNEELQRSLTSLKEERDSTRLEVHSLRFSGNIHDRGGDGIKWRELQSELEYEKSMNSNLSLQLRKTQDSNSELLLEIQDLERLLHERQKQAVDPEDISQQKNKEKKLEASVETLKKELEELDRDSHELTEENMSLLSQLKQANDQMKAKEDTIVQLEMKINNELYLCAEMETEKLKDEVEELRSKLSEYEEAYESKLSSSRTLIDDLNSSVMMVRSKNARVERELQNSEEHISELLKEIESLKSKMEGYEKERSVFVSLKGQLNIFREKASKAELEHRGALKRVEELETSNRELKAEKTRDLTTIRKQLQDFQEHALATDSKYRDTSQALASLRDEKLNLDKEMSALLSAKEAAEANFTKLQSFNMVLQEKLHAEQGKNSELLQQCKEKETKNLQLSEEVKVTTSHVQTLEQTIMELETSAKEVEAHTGSMQTENLVCRSRIKELGELLESLKEEKISLESSASAFEARLQELEALNEELSEKLKNAQEDIDWARENTNTLVNEIRELEGELESEMVVQQRLKQSISELESQKLDWQSQLDELSNKNVQLQKHVLSLEERCKDVLNEKDSLLVTLQEHKKDKHSSETALQAVIKQQEDRIQQLEASSTEEKIQQLLLDASILRDEKSVLEQELKNLQGMLMQAKKDAVEGEKKVKHTLLEASMRTDEKLELEGNVLKLEQMLKQAEKDSSSLKRNLEFQFQEATLKEQDMMKKLNKVTVEAQLLQDEKLELLQKIMGLEAQCAAAELERRKLSIAMSRMEADLELLQREKEVKERAIAGFAGLEAQCAAAEVEKRKLSMAMSQLETNLDLLQREKNVKERTIAGLEAQCEVAELERRKLSMAMSKMETDLGVLQREKEDKERAFAEEKETLKVSLGTVFKIESDLDVLQKEKDLRERAFESLKQEKERLEASLRIAELEIETLEERVKSYAVASCDWEHSKVLLKDSADELNKMKQQNDELGSKLLEEHVEREELRKRATYLEEELQRKTAVLASMEMKINESESFNSLAGSPVHSLSSPSTAKSRGGALSAIPSVREARESANLREKVKVLEGELKVKVAELELSRQQMKVQQAQPSVKSEQEEQQVIKEQSSGYTDQLVKELHSLQSQNAAFCQREIELMSKITSAEALQQEVESLKEEKRVLEVALSNFGAAASSDNLSKKISALEMELAEVLEANNMYKKELQSAFAKQHNVHTAALEKLGSVEQVIQDLADLKRKNMILEDELKDMRQRYFNMSLQFAEVEAEREELVMTIRNLRGAKKLMPFRSSNF
ncbi:hypothetical protein GOP47_0023687 [Adiantum capillus-veneris]|uniref:C2 NT-type domain-containing protein n=1 Tax=Adiantum capillus-veneris TaxID=13818 RepID=A0A9D4U516_ADICA|nr:hypothetical protein GOP47_0023687 [Adiantum capillus-veneris]